MAGPQHVSSHSGTFCEEGAGARAIAALAARQHGVIALSQLEERGMSPSGVRSWVKRGRIHRVHRGVYTLAPIALLPGRGHWMAAVLACGPRAALSHRSAAAHRGLQADNRRKTDISVPTRSVRQRQGIIVHAARSLHADETTVVEGIHCTTVARILFDLAATRPPREVERAAGQAEVLRVLDVHEVDAVLARQIGRPGAAVLASLIRAYAGPTLTESELEELFLDLCDAAGLPRPEVGAWLSLPGGPIKVDFLWRRERLVVETDGHAVHGTRRAFEQDRRRDQGLLVAGYRVVRFTWRQIERESAQVARTVRALLG